MLIRCGHGMEHTRNDVCDGFVMAFKKKMRISDASLIAFSYDIMRTLCRSFCSLTELLFILAAFKGDHA